MILLGLWEPRKLPMKDEDEVLQITDCETAMEKLENIQWLSSIHACPNNNTSYNTREV